MTDELRLSIIRELSVALRNVSVATFSGEEGAERQTMALLDALRLHRRGQLGGVVVAKRYKGGRIGLQEICNTLISDITFSARVDYYVRNMGIKYVGECYYVRLRGLPGEELRQELATRFGLAPDADPLMLGWRPCYWDDPRLRPMLDTSCGDFWSHLEWPVRVCHCFGDFFAEIRGAPPGPWPYHVLMHARYKSESMSDRDLGYPGLKQMGENRLELWPTLILPPDWRTPEWRELEPWKSRLALLTPKVAAALQDEKNDISLEKLGIGDYCLALAGVKTLRNLLSLTPGAFRRIPLGDGGLERKRRIKRRLEDFGLRIGMLTVP